MFSLGCLHDDLVDVDGLAVVSKPIEGFAVLFGNRSVSEYRAVISERDERSSVADTRVRAEIPFSLGLFREFFTSPANILSS